MTVLRLFFLYFSDPGKAFQEIPICCLDKGFSCKYVQAYKEDPSPENNNTASTERILEIARLISGFWIYSDGKHYHKREHCEHGISNPCGFFRLKLPIHQSAVIQVRKE